VSQQHDWLFAVTTLEIDLQMIAIIFCRVNFDLATLFLKFLRQKRAHLVYLSFVVTGRFNLHHALQQLQHFRLMLMAELQVTGDAGNSG